MFIKRMDNKVRTVNIENRRLDSKETDSQRSIAALATISPSGGDGYYTDICLGMPQKNNGRVCIRREDHAASLDVLLLVCLNLQMESF